jgi:hypothetical protein
MMRMRLPVRAMVATIAIAGLARAVLVDGAAKATFDIVGVRVVDYHDQSELPLPGLAGLETLVGRDAAEHAPPGLLPTGPIERPHRTLLRVEFRSPDDLWDIARRGQVVFLHSYFCSRKKDFAVLTGPTVYAEGDAIGPPGREPGRDNVHPKQLYYFFVSASRKASPESVPPQIGFDLAVDPQDVCFYITGQHFKSDRGIVSKAVIAAAFHSNQAQ